MRLRTRYTQRLPTAPGLVLDVPFFEGSGTIAHDLSGKDNHGTLKDVTWSQGEKGVCGSFNGVSSTSDHGNDTSLNLVSNIMFEAYIELSVSYGYRIIATKSGVTDALKPYALWFFGNNNKFYGYIGDGTTNNNVSSNAVATLKRYSIFFSSDGTYLKIYFDIKLQNSVLQDITPTTNTLNFFIGQSGLDSYYFSGII